jgi:hypothetical protein
MDPLPRRMNNGVIYRSHYALAQCARACVRPILIFSSPRPDLAQVFGLWGVRRSLTCGVVRRIGGI